MMVLADDLLEVRDISQGDWEAVLDVYRQCEDFLSLGPEPIASKEMVLRDIEESRLEGGVFCGIYTANERMIGIVDFIPRNFNGDTHLAFLSLLMIATPFRQQGAGARVAGMVENEIMKDTGITAILSAVQVNNSPALRFWRKMGYRIVGGPELQPDGTTTFLLRKDCRRLQQPEAKPLREYS